MSNKQERFPTTINTAPVMVPEQNPNLKIPITKDITVETEDEKHTAEEWAITMGHGITPNTFDRYGRRLKKPLETRREIRFRKNQKYSREVRLYTAQDFWEIEGMMLNDATTPRCHSPNVKRYAEYKRKEEEKRRQDRQRLNVSPR